MLHGTAHANGVTRAGKNTTEKSRAALCYDTSPANKNVTTFGAVWINDTPTSDGTNARWDESMVVAWNATSVLATMWTTAYDCPASQGGVSFNSAQIFGLAAASGGSVPVSFPYGTSIARGTGTTYPGQFTDPPGALRVKLNVTGKASGCYSVAYRGQYRDNRGTGLVNTYFTRVCITRQAVPPATLDGVKIDNQGYDATTRPYGGYTVTPASATVPFTPKTVYASGSGSDARNPFYFTGAAGGGAAIAIGASGSTAHTISVDISSMPTYKLIGYSICYSGQANCTSAGVAYGATYYHALPSGSNSFSWTFVSGRAYHMRWVFKLTAGVECGSFTSTPSIFDSRTPFTAKATVDFTVAYAPVTPTMNLTITPAVSFNGNPATVTPVITASGGTSQATGSFGVANASQLGPTLATGVYNVTWTYDDPGLPPLSCTDSFKVANQPYMHVYGGDVLAGTSVAGELTTNDQLCQTNSDAGVYGWNNHTTNFTGAGAQYAVMALDQILDFSSAAGASNQPTGLSFANTGLSASQLSTADGLFGGSFGGTTVDCNFTAGDVSPTTANSDQTIGATSVGIGVSDIRYVIGANVYITGNIVYTGSAGSWTKAADIPYFKLVVIGGSIYINPGVSQLDGIYVAEQDEDGNGGTIYTCATGMGVPADPTDAASFFSTCNAQLTVNGAFAAQQIQFLRTYGTLGNANTDTRAANNAAEVFNYSPEVWLPRNAAGGMSSKYDAITGLPPVL